VKRPFLAALAWALAALPACKGCDKSGAAPDAAAKALPTAPAIGIPGPSASVMHLLDPSNMPAYQGPTGSVEGTVSVTGPDPPTLPGKDFSKCPAAEATYGKLFRVGAPLPNGSRALADAVVAVTNYAAFVAQGDEAKKVAIGTDCAFPSRTITMTFGQRLEVSNKSTAIIAPALEQVPGYAMMVAPPEERGDPVKLYPPHPGYFTLVDRTSLAELGAGFISEDVYVFLFPTHTVSGLDGHYRIDGIPVGKARVGARLAPVGEVSKGVEIRAGVVEKVDLQLRYVPQPEPVPGDAGRILIP
jgi:hypothetical protein